MVHRDSLKSADRQGVPQSLRQGMQGMFNPGGNLKNLSTHVRFYCCQPDSLHQIVNKQKVARLLAVPEDKPFLSA